MEVLAALALSDPKQAFARLFLELRSDAPRREKCVQAWRGSPAHHTNLHAHIRESLERQQEPRVPEHGDLALLRALDEVLGQPSGIPDHPERVQLEQGAWYLVPLPRQRNSGFSKQPNKLEFWCRHRWLIPSRSAGLHVIPTPGTRRSQASSLEVQARGTIRWMIAAFDQKAPSGLCIAQDSQSFFFADPGDADDRWQVVESLLIEARASEVDILVLPELTMPRSLRERVGRWLASSPGRHPAFVLPGSFHETNAHGDLVNRAEFLDADGDIIFRHDKVAALAFSRNEAPHLVEAIAGGTSFSFLSCALGRIHAAICKDFLEEDPALARLWSEIAPDFVAVASMGDSTTVTAHIRRAQSLSRQFGTISGIANQPTPDVGGPPATPHSEHPFGGVFGPGRGRLQRERPPPVPIRVFDVPLA